MIRTVVVSLFFAASAVVVSGCSTQPGSGQSQAYAPYGQMSNPTCGATGTCAPSSVSPGPMHGDYGAY